MQPVDELHQQKNCKRDDHEVHGRIEETTVGNDRRMFFGVREVGIVLQVECHEVIGEVVPSRYLPDRRHEDVIDERSDNGAESRPNDNCYRQVDYISADCECFEFLQDGHSSTQAIMRRYASDCHS